MDTIKITNSIGETIIELMPTPRKNLAELERLLIEIQATWWGEFSIGGVCADDVVWGKMKQAISLLPIKDCPDGAWTKLDEISNDYAQLEELFFAQKYSVMQEGEAIRAFNFLEFVGCKLCWIHRFNWDTIISKASELKVSQIKKLKEVESDGVS